MTTNLKRWNVLGFLALALALPGSVAANGPVGAVVVFGTSLSDSGNAYAVLGQATTPPDWSVDPFLVPDRPYARGGHHFTNGKTWVEQMARPLGLAASVKPAFAKGGGANFAFGGARAREAGTSPTLGQQIGAFFQATGGQASGNALYVIEMGGNDMRDALLAFAMGDDGGAAGMLSDALAAIAGGIQALHAAGARRFLVWNMPDIGATPALRLTPLAGLADLLAQEYNGKLTGEVVPFLQATLAGADIRIFDVYAKLKAVVATPTTFGLTNVQDACIRIEAPYSCARPNDYLFWDGIHASAEGHGILAHEAAATLAR